MVHKTIFLIKKIELGKDNDDLSQTKMRLVHAPRNSFLFSDFLPFGLLQSEKIVDLRNFLISQISGMDIYVVNDELISTLTKCEKILPISKAFKLCETNADKVKFVEDLLVEYNRIPRCDLRNAKDNNRSKGLRQMGNNLFAQGKPFDALELYNQSICWADSKENSEELAIGYANRSAVYFKWKMYEQATQNIELAKDAGYPKRLMDKLIKRETDCLERINNECDVQPVRNNYVPQLEMEANPQIPFIAKCLEMQESESQGGLICSYHLLHACH